MTVATTRLHVSPLTPDLLPLILGPVLLPLAQNISYHSVQTFPENSFGFVELPVMEAEKLKSKINGATLKGKKIKVDEAKPEKRKRKQEDDPEESTPDVDTIKVRSKKRKSDKATISGHELSPDRKITRGWTEVKDSRSQNKGKVRSKQTPSKYSDKEELLFRTKLPANREELDHETKKKKKSQKSHTPTVVHEFAKTTSHPPFLKDTAVSNSTNQTRYEDGIGWMDEDNNLLEKESERSSRYRKTAIERFGARLDRSKQKPIPGSSIDTEAPHDIEDIDSNEDKTSSSGSSDITSSESDAASPQKVIDAAQPSETATQPEVHPLEALFKKPAKPSSQDVAKPSLEVSTSFSFFEPEVGNDKEELAVPLTPFSSQDFQMRGLRSAAPTPDTAHPSRFNSWGSTGLPGDEDYEAGNSDGQPAEHVISDQTNSDSIQKAPEAGKQSDFEKKFWEQRGDNNRAWKARRRTVLKEKRQRENRARRPKNW